MKKLTPITQRDTEHLQTLCPNCAKPLKSAVNIMPGGRAEVQLWCMNPACKSKAGDAGAKGDSWESAYRTLEDAIIEENCKAEES